MIHLDPMNLQLPRDQSKSNVEGPNRHYKAPALENRDLYDLDIDFTFSPKDPTIEMTQTRGCTPTTCQTCPCSMGDYCDNH